MFIRLSSWNFSWKRSAKFPPEQTEFAAFIIVSLAGVHSGRIREVQHLYRRTHRVNGSGWALSKEPTPRIESPRPTNALVQGVMLGNQRCPGIKVWQLEGFSFVVSAQDQWPPSGPLWNIRGVRTIWFAISTFMVVGGGGYFVWLVWNDRLILGFVWRECPDRRAFERTTGNMCVVFPTKVNDWSVRIGGIWAFNLVQKLQNFSNRLSNFI